MAFCRLPPASRAHRFHVLHEAERARPGDLFCVRVQREVDDDIPVLGAEDRVRKVDGEVELESVEGREARPLVAVADFQRGSHAQIAFGGRLLDDAGGLQQKNERTCTAVHDGQFRTGNVDIQIVDTEPRERRHQMLDGRHTRIANLQCRRQSRVAHIGSEGRNGHRLRKVGSLKHNAGVRRRRSQRHFHARPGV